MRAAIILLLLSARAFADDPPPWSANVSQQTQDAANALFAEANQLFAQQQHAPAIEKYRAAIALWDHPMIHFNLTITLIRVGQPLEAADHLDRALAYDAKPFASPAQYQQALDYRQLLAGQLGYLDVRCTQAGAKVLLDGKAFLDCPGTKKLRVLVGEHVVVAEHPSFVPRPKRLVVGGGSTVTDDITLQSLDDAVVYEYPIRRWIPWTIAGGGAAIAVSGLLVWLSGRSDRDDANARANSACGDGCTDQQLDDFGISSDLDSARFKSRLGIALVIAGGATSAIGAFFAVTNRPRRVVPTIDASARSATVSATWHF